MKRDFTHNGIKYLIVNKHSMDKNTFFYPKYDIMKFDTDLKDWVRVKSCTTIEEGYNIIRGKTMERNNYYYNKGYLQGVKTTIDKLEDLIYHDYNITLDILIEIKDILIFDKE